MNDRALRYIMRRDFPGSRPPTCLYCGRKLSPTRNARGDMQVGAQKPVLDHLDGNRRNNNYSNLALCHQRCNAQKEHNIDYRIIAQNKLAQNQAYVPIADQMRTFDQRVNENVKVGRSVHKFAKEWLEINVKGDTWLPLEDVCDEIGYLLQERFGHGHAETARKHVKMCACRVAPWIIKDVDGEAMIGRRVPEGDRVGPERVLEGVDDKWDGSEVA